jgi:hypothetical protein
MATLLAHYSIIRFFVKTPEETSGKKNAAALRFFY